MSPTSDQGWIAGITSYVRAWLRAITDERTFDARRNPGLWLGFVLALPIPILTFAANADIWLELLTLLAPPVWAVILGAAGRMAIEAEEHKRDLVEEVHETRQELGEKTEELGQETRMRRELELDRDGVLAELSLARAVQQTLMSENIHRPECEVVIHQVPSRYVGGDYVSASVVEDRWLYLVISDVSGHGVAAALVVARMHGLVRRMTLTKKRPTEVLERMNRAALHIFKHTFFFMTVGVFRLDLRTGMLEYSTAGHPEQILLHADGTSRGLRTRNRLLGMDDDVFAEKDISESVQLVAGDTVVLFTDGLFEILKDGEGEVLGEAGLHHRIQSVGTLDPALLVGETLQEIASFQGHSQFDDDVTIVAMRFHAPTA